VSVPQRGREPRNLRVALWSGVTMIVCGFALLILAVGEIEIVLGAIFIVFGIFVAVWSLVRLQRQRS
jgi:hypothetical protein